MAIAIVQSLVQSFQDENGRDSRLDYNLVIYGHIAISAWKEIKFEYTSELDLTVYSVNLFTA